MEPTDRARLAGLMEEAADAIPPHDIGCNRDDQNDRYVCKCGNLALASRLRAEAAGLRGQVDDSGNARLCGCGGRLVWYCHKCDSEPATGAACGACGGTGLQCAHVNGPCASCHGTGRAGEAGR